MPNESDTYRKSCATHRCTARIESSSVFASFTTSAIFASIAGVVAYRSRARLAYQCEMSLHERGDAIVIDSPYDESGANGSGSGFGMSFVAHVITLRPFDTCSTRANDR